MSCGQSAAAPRYDKRIMTPPHATTDLRDQLTDATLVKESAFIGGEWIGSGKTIAVHNPANGDTIGHVPDLGGDETRRAIAAAGAAFPQWRALPAVKRSQLLEAWYDAIVAQAEDLARLMTLEQGKTASPNHGARSRAGARLREVVLGRSEAGVRRNDFRADSRSPDRRAEGGTGRRVRGDYPDGTFRTP